MYFLEKKTTLNSKKENEKYHPHTKNGYFIQKLFLGKTLFYKLWIINKKCNLLYDFKISTRLGLF